MTVLKKRRSSACESMQAIERGGWCRRELVKGVIERIIKLALYPVISNRYERNVLRRLVRSGCRALARGHCDQSLKSAQRLLIIGVLLSFLLAFASSETRK